MLGQVVQIGRCQLILGDIRLVLPQLQEKADLILTDPPYLLTSGGNSTGEMKGCFSKDRYDNSGALFEIVPWDDLAPVIFEAAQTDADAIVMANDRNLSQAQAALEAAGWRFHRILVWDKCSVTPNRWFMQGLEYGLYMWRGRARPINDKGAHPLFRVPQVDVTQHPTEKPVALFQRWIELTTWRDGLVIDPFLGSGSAAVAAHRAGRRFIGVEKDPRWFDIAVARLQAEVAAGQKDMQFSEVLS